MPLFIRNYTPQIIVILVGIILALLLILFTDMHVDRINRQMNESIHVAKTENLKPNTNASHHPFFTSESY